nr:protein FAR1-related sequence 5 [Tanacetum cinerariifolium]
MMHMEHYNEETVKNWNLEFSTEEEGNRLDIIKMRVRLATKILSHEINIHQEKISLQLTIPDCCSIPFGTVVNAFTKEIIAYEKESDETHAVKKLDALCTPESFVTHSNFNTPGGTVYYIPKYDVEAWFVVRSSCQKRLRNRDVKTKYLVCNRKGCTKGIHVDTLDLENSDKQKRNSHLYITGCKTHAVFNLDPRTRKFVLNVFDTIHNHELEREEFKHLSKREMKLTYLEQAFIVKAASLNIGATRAYHLVTAIDNHRKCVTVAACLLKNETTKSYIWLLKAFIKAFRKAPSIVVTNQDGAMRNAIEAEFAGLKHRLYMWHITQKLPAKKEIFVGLWNCQIDLKSLVEGSEDVDKCKDKAEEDDPIDLFFKKDGLYKVLRNIRDGLVVCSCQLFVRVGILCKHIFCVFKNANAEMIPQQYILRRWMKNLIPVSLRNKRNRYGEKNVVVENFVNEATSIVDYYVHLLSKDAPRLGAFVEKLKSLKKDVEADCPNPPSKNKIDNLEQLVRVPNPPVVEGRNSCLLRGGTNHNKRTCPGKFDVENEVVLQKKVCHEEVVVQKEPCQEEVVQEKVDFAEDEEELVEEDEVLIHE